MWRNEKQRIESQAHQRKKVVPNDSGENDESNDWWVCLKNFWIKCLMNKYSTFQQQQQQQLLNLLFLYHKTLKRCVKISTKNIGISLFYCTFFSACMHAPTYITICLSNMGVLCDMKVRYVICGVRCVI